MNTFDTFSGYCLHKVLVDPSSLSQFLRHVKLPSIPSRIDFQILIILEDHYNPETSRFHVGWKTDRRLKAQHVARLKHIKEHVEIPHDSDILTIARGIQNEFRQKHLYQLGNLCLSGVEKKEDALELATKAQVILDQVLALSSSPIRHCSESVKEIMEAVEMSLTDRDDLIPSGFRQLDFLLDGGYSKGEFVVVASTTGFGKSFFMGQTILEMLQAGKRVLVYGLEMDDRQYGMRLVAAIASVAGLPSLKLSNLRRPKRYGVNKSDLEIVLQAYAEYPLYFYQEKDLDVAEFCSSIKNAYNEYKFDVLCLDHTLLLKPNKSQNEAEMLIEVCKFMKNFATEKGIISFAVSQMTRDTDITKPNKNNIAGSRAVENQATTLLVIGEPEKPKEKGQDRFTQQHCAPEFVNDKLRKITILKSREAASNTYFLAEFRPSSGLFKEIFPDNWDEIKDGDPNDHKLVYTEI